MNTQAKFEEKIGCLVGWSLKDVHVPQNLATLFTKKHGLEEDFNFPKLTITSGYRRAIKSITSKGEHDTRALVAIRIRDDEDYVSHALVSPEVVNSDGSFDAEVNFDSQIKVGFNKKGLIFDEQFITNKPDHPVVKEIKEVMKAKSAAFSANDIRSAFQRAFNRWNAVRVLPSGGLWWIPEKFSDKVEAWKLFLQDISRSSTVITIPTFNNDDTVNSIQNAARNSLFSRLETIKHEIESFNDKTRQSTVTKKIEALNELKKKATFYEEVLEMQKEFLSIKILEAEASVKQSLQGDANGTSLSI